MIINSQKIREIDRLIREIDATRNKNIKNHKKISLLRAKLQRMSLQRMSVERSGNKSRISEFNRRFVQILAELSKMVQTTGTSDRDKIAQIVREIKAK